MFANPQVFFKLSMEMLQRNNPMEKAITSLVEMIENVITHNSKMKLLKYKFMLAQQQLDNIENNLNHADPLAEVRGSKLNKAY